MAGPGAGEVAGGVERDPAVEADDQEGEQRLGQPATRVATGRVAQVEPDRIGDAVGVVVDIEGDLAGGRVGHEVGEGRRVMAVGRDRPEDPRRRVGPRRGRVLARPVVDTVLGIEADDPRAVERRDDHPAVGALDRQEPVLEIAGVVILVHADGGEVARPESGSAGCRMSRPPKLWRKLPPRRRWSHALGPLRGVKYEIDHRGRSARCRTAAGLGSSARP